MKILTLNTHSIIEENYESKLKQFVVTILLEKPEVFGLQEVNQTMEAPKASNYKDTGYVPCEKEDIVIRSDNHALRIARILQEAGLTYEWTWVPIKIGYDKYEEGLALFSSKKITDTKQFYISTCRDKNNWKSRKMLGIKTDNIWFYTVHMGWWDDVEEPFSRQWDRVNKELSQMDETETCFIMGDFNCPAEIPGEGYDYVTNSGWLDTWKLAERKDVGITVGKIIDGWKERMKDEAKEQVGMRIDYIWCNKQVVVELSRVVFNGKAYPVVSDHYGVEIVVGER